MVGLADIPVLGKAIEKISDASVEAVFRGLHYMFCYKHLVDVLNSEIEKVNIEEVRVSSKTVAARADGKIIYDHVLKWQTDLEEFHETAKEFSEVYKTRGSGRCIQRLPIPNPITRFRLGREAVQKTNKVIELTESGTKLLANEIAYLPQIENVPNTDASFQNFQSRKDAYEKLWEMLVTEGSSMMHGIYGMPGVGKTRMMEQLWEEAMEKKIFDKVTRADVGSDSLDVVKLQNQLARHLGCHFKSQDDTVRRATQLKNSLLNGGKILVILDDVWSEIPLHIIGIPHGDGSNSKGCKILLTSREKDVCLLNECKHPVKITTLTADEALDLFRNTVGTYQIESLRDDTLVQDVCKKCAGLPLLIHAVGKALKFRSHSLWKDALYKLEKGNFANIAGIDPQAYACVKLSIDRLPHDAKSCLFLCSLFREDANIDIRMLISLATGSQLLPSREFSIRAMVDLLISSSLLLEVKRDECVKLHDIIRDVASSIAFTDKKYAFLHLRCASRLPDNANFGDRKLLHIDVDIDVERNDFHFHEDLVCLDLQTLWLHCNNLKRFSGGFLSMFVNLRFLMLQYVKFFPEQFSLKRLGGLRDLFLDCCDTRQINLSLLPENLESVCFRNCRILGLLELPNLKYLRKLEILDMTVLEVMEVVFMPNTISNLSSLEELHIPNGFSYLDDASNRLSQDEICKSTRLRSLKIHLDHFEPCPGTTIFSSLLAYHICVGAPDRYDLEPGALSVLTTRLIEVYNYHSTCLEGLMERSEELKLCRSDVIMSNIWNSNRKAFADLRNLYIKECKNMEYLARISPQEIQHSRQPQTYFSNLIVLQIIRCSAMKYLFCNSVAKCLMQLQDLSIYGCPLMEVIILNEGTTDGRVLHFSKLKSLKLQDVPRLTSFYGENEDMRSSSTSKMDNSAISSFQFQPLFDGKAAFPSLEELELHDLEYTSDIWGKHHNNDYNESSFCKLKRLDVSNCNKLEIVIPLSMLHRLRNLEFLDINCCKGLRNMFVSSIARDLTHLKHMHVGSCDIMREIIGAGEQEEITDAIIVFPELTVLGLDCFRTLTSFWSCESGEAKNYKVKFPNLVEFSLRDLGEINLDAIELGRDDSTCQLRDLTVSGIKVTPPSQWQVRSHNLETLGLHDNDWCHEMQFLQFKNLKFLTVKGSKSKCTSLFKVSVLGSLQQLRRLRIESCELLEEIAEEDSGVAAASCLENNTITLFHLESIILKNLTNLKSFSSSASYVFNMPRLDELIMFNCPQLETFTSLKISTGKTVDIDTESGSCELTSDLNDYVRQYHKRGSAIGNANEGIQAADLDSIFPTLLFARRAHRHKLRTRTG